MQTNANTNASTKVNMLFVECGDNDNIQYSFIVDSNYTLPNDFIGYTTCCAPDNNEAIALTKLNSDDAYKAFYKAFSN
jgi:hypothetical protein